MTFRQQEVEKEEAEEKARALREKMKERKVADDPTPSISGPIIEPGKNDPYGRWKTVQTRLLSFFYYTRECDYT